MNFDGLYKIRPAKESDRGFIVKTFVRDIYDGNKLEHKCNTCGTKQNLANWITKIPEKLFIETYKPVANSLFDRATIRIACLPDDEDTILGACITSHADQTLHWVYVKKKWRRHGIGRSLVPKDIKIISNLTNLGETLLSKLNTTVVFNPFIGVS